MIISSITRSGSIATATSSSAHGLVTGVFIDIFGANQSEYNVAFIPITVLTATTFTYPVAGTPVTPATGTLTAVPNTIKTIKATGGDYTSLSAAEAGEQRDLVTLDEIATIQPYSINDITPVVIAGSPSDATHFMRVIPPQSDRASAKWDITKYRLEPSAQYDYPVQILQAYTQFLGVQVRRSWSGSGDTRDDIYANAAGVTIAYNLLTSAGVPTLGISFGSGASGHKIYNNIIYGLTGKAFDGFGSGTFYNNTIVNCGAGFGKSAGDSGSTWILKNNLVSGSTGADYENLSGTFVVDYCSSSDATADDWGGTGNRINQTYTFVDAVNDDYHLASGDTGAKDFGTDLSADAMLSFTDDIDGDIRSGTWDIGADEYMVASGGVLFKIISETAQVSDGYVRRMAMTRPVSETESLTEGVLRRGALRRILSETINVTEGLLRRGALKRVISETQNLTETVVKSLSTLIIKVVNEGLNIAGAVVRRLGLTRAVGEGISLSEGTTRRGALRRILNETASVAEGVVKRMSLARIAAETMSLVETAIKRSGLVRVVSGTLSIAEGALKYLGLVKVVNEGLNIIEGIIKKLGFDTLGVLGENLTLIFNSVRRGIKSMTTQRGIVSKTPKREVKP